MDSGTKRRLVWSFLSNIVSSLSQTIIQFIQIPVFLRFWPVPLYGEWMILTTFPNMLAFGSVGFGMVAGNEMTMLIAAGERDRALKSFQSCWWLIVSFGTLTMGLLSAALYYLPAARLLNIHSISEVDTKWIIFSLGISVMLSQIEGLLQAAYRSIGRYPYGGFIKSMMALGAFACTMVSVALGQGALVTAQVYAAANIAGTILLICMVKHDIAWIEFGWKHARFSEIRRITVPSIAYMGFPIGNAFNQMGSQMAINYALGPVSVVAFSTARTVSRIALKLEQMASSTFEPELTLSFGAGKIDLTRALHRRSCQLALILTVITVSVVMLVGPNFLHHWTRGHVPPSRGLLSLLLLVVVVYSLWSTSSALMTSTNQHQRMALVYIVATSMTCVACYFLACRYGLYGAASALLISELAMNCYVLPASLRIAQDTFPAFISSMLHYPQTLKPAALLARFRRSNRNLEV